MISANDDSLVQYIATYTDAIESTRYAELEALQPPPFASLAHGASGTAYALWRLGRNRRAHVWARAALADRRVAAYSWEGYVPAAGSYMYGRGGPLWVRALIGGAPRAKAVTAYMRCVAHEVPREFIAGEAGALTGACLLLARFEDRHLRAFATHLAEKLGRSFRARSRRPWKPLDTVGFAHHWPGIVHALLGWSATNGEVPAWLVDGCRRFLSAWSPATVRNTHLHGSWCNGLAGAALLWTKAFAVTGDTSYLTAARDAGRGAIAAPSVGADLCCGAGGVAYALLALERIDPGQGWKAQARQLADRAIANPAMKWPNGLLRGHPGLVCLALDLLAERPIGFPGIEG